LWKHIVIGIKKMYLLMPILLLFLIKMYIIITIVSYFFLYQVYIMVPLSIILVLPFVTWLKIGFLEVLGEKSTAIAHKKRKKSRKKRK